MFWWLIGYDKENYRRELDTRSEIVTNLYLYKMNNLISESEFKRQMQNFKIPEVQDEPTKNEVLTKSENGFTVNVRNLNAFDLGDVVCYWYLMCKR